MANRVMPNGLRLTLWLRDNFKLVLLGANVLVAALLVYCVISWTAFEFRTRSLLALADRIEKQIQGEVSPEMARSPAADARGWRIPLLSEASARTAGKDAAAARSGNGGLAPAAEATSAGVPGVKQAGGKSTPSPDPADEKRRAQFAKLENRALFGEPRLAVQLPRVEAILGELALVDGRWLTRGGRAGDFTLCDLATNNAVMTDEAGTTRNFPILLAAEGLAFANAGPGRRGFASNAYATRPKNKGNGRNTGKNGAGNANFSGKAKGRNADKTQFADGKIPKSFASGLTGEKVLKKALTSLDRSAGGGGKPQVSASNKPPKMPRDPSLAQSGKQGNKPPPVKPETQTDGKGRPPKKGKARR